MVVAQQFYKCRCRWKQCIVCFIHVPLWSSFADTTIWEKAHHHVFIMASADGGASWSAPFDVVRNQAQGGNGEFEEAAYPSMARNIRSYEGAALIYQRDSIPGAGVSSNLCFNRKTLNDIVLQSRSYSRSFNCTGDDKIHTSVYPSPVKIKWILNSTCLNRKQPD